MRFFFIIMAKKEKRMEIKYESKHAEFFLIYFSLLSTSFFLKTF